MLPLLTLDCCMFPLLGSLGQEILGLLLRFVGLERLFNIIDIACVNQAKGLT
jgi:hypothetical protein